MVRWGPFIEGLRVHEAGHVRIENEHLKDVLAAIIGSKCDETKATMDAVTARIAIIQKAYDRETRDGETQGAVLR
jgi:predicted secreted Zn-dependent protease